ncbi:MAG: peptidylprolyl isomerase [Alphaproteobacteria bacterium]|jgi:peptidyl-prolyl cis-trans isomerase SurA|nr:peptidylprolyl isomerase [Alphaproteobacteria bacterium]
MVRMKARIGRLALAGIILPAAASLPMHAQSGTQARLSQPTLDETPASPDSLPLEGIAAIVNDTPISYSDVRERARLLLMSFGSQPNQEQIQQITGQALEQLIDEKLQLQEAAEYEVEVASEDIDSAIQDMARQSGATRDQLVQQLLAAGVNPSSLEQQMRADIAWRRVMSGLYGSRIRISENQVDERLQQLRTSSSETQYRISEIFLYAPDASSQAQALEAAASIRAQLEQGAPFEMAAQRFSSSPTAATGGDMGWVTLEDIDPALAEAVSEMEGPGLSEPIAAGEGVYLLAVRNRRAPQDVQSVVSLTRLASQTGEREALVDAMDRISGCDDIETVARETDGLSAASLGRIALSELSEDAADRIAATATGEATDIFETGGRLSVMYVCERGESGGNLPGPDQVENQLFGQQLSMISERALRNLRREATIIRR